LPAPKNKQKAVPPKKRRRRRSTEEIIDRLLDAACVEFERNGYAGTKTATIAKRAGVTEALIFTNFGSKAKLFRDAIFKPLDRHFVDFCATHLTEPGDNSGQLENAREYIEQLQDFIEAHSKMLSSLVAAQMYATDEVEGLSQVEGLHAFFNRATAGAMNRLTEKPRVDPRLLARVSFATILACTIFKGWLFPPGLATKEEISAAITDFLIYGLTVNADSAGWTVRAEPAQARPVRKARRKVMA
jgi:AcrR family transcriptional regulator